MTQTRVFVTYLPARPRPVRAVSRSPGSLAAPATTVLASALLAGGAIHAVGGAREFAQPTARVALDAAQPSGPLRPAMDEPLPFLALAASAMAPATERAGAAGLPAPAETVAQPARAPLARASAARDAAAAPPPRPIAGKRLDLAGFLDDQGFALAAKPPLAEPASGAAESRAAVLPAGEPALAESAIAPLGSAPSPAAAPLPAEAQTFPTVTIDGVALGAVTMRGDTVHLSSLVGLLELRMPAEEFERLQSAPAADSFVSIATLRAAGLDVAVDPAGEQITLAAR